MTNEELDTYVRAHQADYVDAGTKFLAELAAVIGSSTVLLDIGCGRQTFGEEIYAKAGRRVGVDVDDYAKENPLMDEVVITNGKSLPFPDASFDVVTSQWVAEHVEDAEGFVREVMRVLKPGGTFIFMTPNGHSPFVLLTNVIPTPLRTVLRSRILGFKHDETFPAYYRMNDAKTIHRLFRAAGAIAIGISYQDTYGYYRFSKLLVRIMLFLYAALNRISYGRQHHMVVTVKK